MRTFCLHEEDCLTATGPEPTLGRLVVAATLGVFAELGGSSFDGLLDAVAEDRAGCTGAPGRG